MVWKIGRGNRAYIINAGWYKLRFSNGAKPPQNRSIPWGLGSESEKVYYHNQSNRGENNMYSVQKEPV